MESIGTIEIIGRPEVVMVLYMPPSFGQLGHVTCRGTLGMRLGSLATPKTIYSIAIIKVRV